jgi:hypothetical protein
MDRGHRDMDPCGSDGWMFQALLHCGAHGVDKPRHLLGGGRLKDDLLGSVIDDVGAPSAEASGAGSPVPRKYAIVEADEELRVPPEGGIGATEDKTHCIAIAAYQRRVLFARLCGTVPSKDSVDLLDRDGDSLHRGRGGDRLSLKVPAEPTSPGPWQGTSIVELRPPAVQFRD